MSTYILAAEYIKDSLIFTVEFASVPLSKIEDVLLNLNKKICTY